MDVFYRINFYHSLIEFHEWRSQFTIHIIEYSVVLNSMSSDKRDQIRLPIVGVDFIIFNMTVSFWIKKKHFDKNLFIWQNVLNLIEAAGDMFLTIIILKRNKFL